MSGWYGNKVYRVYQYLYIFALLFGSMVTSYCGIVRLPAMPICGIMNMNVQKLTAWIVFFNICVPSINNTLINWLSKYFRIVHVHTCCDTQREHFYTVEKYTKVRYMQVEKNVCEFRLSYLHILVLCWKDVNTNVR